MGYESAGRASLLSTLCLLPDLLQDSFQPPSKPATGWGLSLFHREKVKGQTAFPAVGVVGHLVLLHGNATTAAPCGLG